MCATLVDQWICDGVTHAMVAPGSRSTPMALALTGRPEIHVEVFHDERSAAFAALGAGLATAIPAVLLCTSGTASTHFHAAVVEAHLADVAMLVVTADRPPELRDVGAAQTIDQTGLYGSSVRWFHDPGVAASDAAASWRALARNAFNAATAGDGGPVHLNLSFREPLVAEPAELPMRYLGPINASGRVASGDVVRLGTLAMELERERGVIVAGRGVDDPAMVEALATATGWPILADPRSSCRGLRGSVSSFDAILRSDDFATAHLPDVVVHLGEPPASKVLGEWLRNARTQVRVSNKRGVIDPAHTITHRVHASPGAFCARLAKEVRGATGSDWAARWATAAARSNAALDDAMSLLPTLTEPGVARLVSMFDGWAMVASSMPIRDIEWFGSPGQRARIVSNRGANGIDGTIATAVGFATASGQPIVALLGDVALLHDQSSLTALSRRSCDVRIVVIDNDGGGIFSFLPQASSLPNDRFERLFGTPHGTDLCALAEAHGLPAATVSTAEALEQWLGRPGPWLVRVPSTRTANVAVHRALNDAVVSGLRA